MNEVRQQDMAPEEKRSWLESHDEGYSKGLKPRQVQMIAIGGAIGTGLFLGAGARLQLAGPSLALVYLHHARLGRAGDAPPYLG
jgi:L-asparagine permease